MLLCVCVCVCVNPLPRPSAMLPLQQGYTAVNFSSGYNSHFPSNATIVSLTRSVSSPPSSPSPFLPILSLSLNSRKEFI